MSETEIIDNFKSAMLTNPVICFSSQSGSGKGTQTELFLKTYQNTVGKKLLSIETGALFRERQNSFSSFFRDEIKKTQDSGKLQSFEFSSYLWRDVIFKKYTGGPIIIDGSPRSLDEARSMKDFFVYFLKKKMIVFNFPISHVEAVKRIQERNNILTTPRTDTDTLEKINEKLAYFDTHVEPALSWIAPQKNMHLINIDATLSKQEVHKKIIKSIGDLLTKYH